MKDAEKDKILLALQFLQTWNHQPLGKTFYGNVRVDGAPRCTFYRSVKTERFSSPLALFTRLTEASEERDLAPMTAALTSSGETAMYRGMQLEQKGELPSSPETFGGAGIRRKFVAEVGYEDPHVIAQSSPLLFIDIDNILVESDDETWKCDLEGFARKIIKNFLPPAFLGVSCWASLSSSSGMKRTDTNDWLVGLHLVFIADTPLDGERRQQLVLLDQPDVDPALGKVDIGPLRCTQLFYISSPEFLDGAVDPVPTRSIIVQNRCELVPVSLSELRTYERARPKGLLGRRTDGLLPTEPGYRGYLSYLGDGGNLGGFHAPLRSALASLAATLGQDIDWSAVKEELRDAIDRAPKHRGRERDILRYKSDSYLDESYRGALTKFRHPLTAPPRYKVPNGSLAKAEASVDRFVQEFFNQVPKAGRRRGKL